ncbi:ABC transporter ATP-binding protein [Geomicrobium sediminis]|uniref:ATP-binding cassette subfamily B protein AbcA/BmrA n=1 Tax=Geomicrobium sediminis TaxID=1347788 RepID=A0ABS2P7V5_9BACL|nr:ABC transporter ATP-binding protein [Geomicrobium sediminis]MBM7631493.1 ATP-binding cassette subfamily B protein AbcA/BmrA [Geomicrobium sediminis]
MSEKKRTIKDFYHLFQQYRPRMWIVIVAIALVIGESLLSLIVPLITMNIVNAMVAEGFQLLIIATLVVVFVAQIILSGVSLYMMIYVGETIVARLRTTLWNKILYLPIQFFDQHSSGETMSRVTNDTNVIKDFFTMQLIPFFSSFISIIGSVILLFVIDWKMALLLVLFLPLAMLVILPLGSRMYTVSKSLQDETAAFQGDLGRVLGEIRLVKLSIAEPVEEKQGKTRIQSLFGYGMREGKIMAIVMPLMTTVTLVALVIVFGYGGIQVAQGTLTAGALVAVVFYIFQIIFPVTQLAQFYTQFQKAMGATDRIQSIFEFNSEKEKLNSSEKTDLTDLTFNNVSFQYNTEKTILSNVSFTARSGQMTAFVGPSGAGKTTLFSLIERFYLPNEGNIYYDGTDIQSYKLHDWRSKIAYVSQDSPLMAGSIYKNLTYGLDDVDEQTVKDAVLKANLSSFIEDLPQGYSTEVGERGIRVSGGQRQRLAIARAIIRDPELLLLDEATAHLDSHSEALVQEALQSLMKNRTTLVIAHRLSTVKDAHQLIVLERGVVTGAGNHQALYENHPLYRELVDHQMMND